MRSAEPPQRRGDLVLALGTLAALLVTLLPLLRVVEPGPWLPGTVALIGLLLAVGWTARRFRLPAVAVSLSEAAVWVLFMSGVFLREQSLLGLVPTPASVQSVMVLVRTAMDEVYHGVAPMAASLALSMLIVGAAGLLTIAVDHVVITARMPLVAAIALVMVSLIPAIAVPVEPDIVAFVLLAVCILFLVRIETQLSQPASTAPAAPVGVSATAVGIGAVAVVVALVITPALPQPVLRAGANPFGTGIGLDASLELGSDLRRPREIEVLLMRTDAPSAPYLRAATLTSFDGDVWEPDDPEPVPLEAANAFGPTAVDSDIRVEEYTTTVEIKNLASPLLPVPHPAVSVTGLAGEWDAQPASGTVLARAGSSQGQSYQVVTRVPLPTLEQIRARRAVRPGMFDGTLALPADMPPIIAETAREVTADATTDYDRLIALQSWFRTSGFRYSLSAPVAAGFDGSGVEAIAEFLTVRAGYCIHFSSAFAVMARTLGMPTRIVVGYLPGASTGDVVEDQTVESVTTSRAHAWPEVYFDGIGWVAFEPTASLGSPTSFIADPSGDSGGGSDPVATAAPTSAPTASQGPRDLDRGDSGQASGPAASHATGWPPLTTVVLLLLVLAVPAGLRALRRRRLLAWARDGEAAAAWALVQDAALDLGIPVPASESPRALGARLIAEHGAPAEPMQRLVSDVERALYARVHDQRWQAGAPAEAAVAVTAALMAGAAPARRLLAIVAPRSLVVRPGTVYAGAVGSTR